MKTEQFLNYTPGDITIRGRAKKGELFGLELELEGRGVGLNDVATRGWNRHHDGSLRGDAIEFTTAGAKPFEETRKSVETLFKKFKENNVKINNSIRTSTHVHLNFGDKPIKQVVNFFVLFTIFEEVLSYYSGEDRKGNVFCLSTRDAEGIVGVLSEALATCSLARFSADRYKYAACNLSSLYKFGTVEVRTMRGARTAEEVNSWLDILNDMYKYSLKMKSPVELIAKFSYLGATGLMREVFQAHNVEALLKTFPTPANLHASLMDGVRIVQVLAYEFEPAFVAEVKKAKLPDALPWYFRNAQGVREAHAVYLPGRGGRRWNCLPAAAYEPGAPPDGFWKDGEGCSDDRNIIWRQNIGRFVRRTMIGDETPLDWFRHPVFGDERRDRAPQDPFMAFRDEALRIPEEGRWPQDWPEEEEPEDWPEEEEPDEGVDL